MRIQFLCGALVMAGLFTSPAGIRGEDKKGETKSPATGTLRFDGKDHKLDKSVAFETKQADKKYISVLLSADAVDLNKLKASLKKKGNDEDYFFFKPHVKLIFEESGDLHQLVIYCDGASINQIGSSNVKGKATIKDGAVSGKANMVKPDTFVKKEYTFEVEFNVKLMKPE